MPTRAADSEVRCRFSRPSHTWCRPISARRPWEQAKVLADHITEKNVQAAYHGSKVATKLKVMGVEVASMGIVEPRDDEDEVVQFSEPKRGTYKKLIIRDGRLVGGILLGDIGKAAYLMQAFDRNTPLPEERLRLLFDIGDPPKQGLR